MSEAVEEGNGARRPLRRLAAGLNSDGALYVVLLLLVWGLTVPMRGLWQDDTLLLRLARTFQGHGFIVALTPVVAPLRRLYTLPFRLALATPQPIWTLHLIFGLTWLGQALAAGWIARLLLPGRRLTRFLAICLTLTATSDYLTDNLTSLGYNLAALMLLLAVGCCLRYLTGGSAGWIALACAATRGQHLDARHRDPRPAVRAVAPVLARRAPRPGGGFCSLLSALGLTLAPAVPHRVAVSARRQRLRRAVAMQPMRLAERLDRILGLWRENFAPWRWAFARPGLVSPAAGGDSAVGYGARRGRGGGVVRVAGPPARYPEDPDARGAGGADRPDARGWPGSSRRWRWLANAAYAGLQMAEIHYRTHILSRTWASLALAVLVGWAAQQWPRLRAGLLLVPVLFVGFGVWGGLERQDLWVSTWRLHQRELLSIVTAAPALTPGTGIILRSAPTPDLYLATEADYLAQSWLVLLYDDPAIHALRLAPDRGTGCRATPEGLDCWHEGQAECFAAGTCAADRFPYEKLVILDFDDRKGTWRLLPASEGDPLLGASGAAPAGYRPAGRILKRPLTPRQRALLLE